MVDVMLTYHGNTTSRVVPTLDLVDWDIDALTDKVSTGRCVLNGIGPVFCTGNTIHGELDKETST